MPEIQREQIRLKLEKYNLIYKGTYCGKRTWRIGNAQYILNAKEKKKSQRINHHSSVGKLFIEERL